MSYVTSLSEQIRKNLERGILMPGKKGKKWIRENWLYGMLHLGTVAICVIEYMLSVAAADKMSQMMDAAPEHMPIYQLTSAVWAIGMLLWAVVIQLFIIACKVKGGSGRDEFGGVR